MQLERQELEVLTFQPYSSCVETLHRAMAWIESSPECHTLLLLDCSLTSLHSASSD